MTCGTSRQAWSPAALTKFITLKSKNLGGTSCADVYELIVKLYLVNYFTFLADLLEESVCCLISETHKADPYRIGYEIESATRVEMSVLSRSS